MTMASTQFARVWIGGLRQPKMGRSGMVGGTNLDPSRETNLDLLHVASHAMHVALCCAILSQEAEKVPFVKKGRDCRFMRFVIRYLPTNIGVAFHDPF